MPGITLPAFPDNVPTHSLPTIDFELLKAGNQVEIDRLWEAAVTLGFWYLKNHGAEHEVKAMFDLGAEMFALPWEDKILYEQGDSGRSFGYKKMGGTAVDASGLADMTEFLNIAKDDVLAFPEVVHLTYPSVVAAAIPSVVHPFVCKSLEVNTTVLRIFTQRLGLSEGTLEALHARDLPSASEARIIRSPPMPGKDTADRPTIGSHTDFGSLTFLHNILGGLQVLLPGETQWGYVKPIPGHAICNVGDALTVLSGGILKSAVHRVVPPPGAQGERERWSLVFFTRPNNTQILRALVEDSQAIAESVKQFPEGKFETGSTAEEWFSRRIKYQRLKNREGPQSWAASRGTEHDPTAR
ncbi:hypothetical protein BKA82DRAFT_994495 [Pisolithus tinctorius]|uniref:Fe2OG dioxygenase domain-containing protein n=1 Tax=Pisolithus tinctorius Marx 270 TaxID=870435 RepID=A0A0C3PDJ5_PISTI|nr:hypothetical protein BKA82DRAFT_994495 [Pisolithus tinctorius]KIO11830.1 hypothetical protein M404DRAFT_994495 [Pisolithus tinctorius Marx 270]